MSPDGWVRYYFDHRDSGAALTVNMIDSTGRAFAKKCEKCGKNKRAWGPLGDPVCASHRCKAPWPYEDRDIPRGGVQTSLRADHHERKIGTYMDVARELARLRADLGVRADLYIASAVLGYSRQALVEARPWPGFEYTDWHVRQAIKDARAEWSLRLKRIGLLT